MPQIKLGRYSVLQRATVRLGVELASASAGQLDVGDNVKVVEVRFIAPATLWPSPGPHLYCLCCFC